MVTISVHSLLFCIAIILVVRYDSYWIIYRHGEIDQAHFSLIQTIAQFHGPFLQNYFLFPSGLVGLTLLATRVIVFASLLLRLLQIGECLTLRSELWVFGGPMPSLSLLGYLLLYLSLLEHTWLVGEAMCRSER